MNEIADIMGSPWKNSFLSHNREMNELTTEQRFESVDYPLEQWYTRDDATFLPKRVENIASQALIAEAFANRADKQMLQIKREICHYQEQFTLAGSEKARYIEKLRGLQQVYKAERDLWALLEIFCRSNIFHNIDDERNQKLLTMTINGLDVRSSIPNVINEVMKADERIRKGAILVEWLESCASDEVQEIPELDSQNMRTTQLLLNSSNTTHTSKTTGKGGTMELFRPCNDNEAYDQEVLLKCIWELLRSGQLKRAQEVAVNHNAYWLASILLGGVDSYYVDGDDSEAPILMGNVNKAKWMRSCWQYSQQLFDNPKLFAADHTSIISITYEMSIYAVLSNNFGVLYDSALVSNTWTNQLWSWIKCSHTRDILECVYNFHLRQREYSPHFLACHPSNLSALEELISSQSEMLRSNNVMTGSCTQILDQVPPPNNPTAEAMFLSFQASVISGKEVLVDYVHSIRTLISVSKI